MLLPYVLIVSTLAVLFLTGWILWLHRRLNRLFTGRGGQNLEELAFKFGAELAKLNRSQLEVERFLAEVDERLSNSVRHVRTARYNPFADRGGNQSFSTALLNEKGDGVILTGLHARDTMRVYAKPVRKHASDFELTAEERGVLVGDVSKS